MKAYLVFMLKNYIKIIATASFKLLCANIKTYCDSITGEHVKNVFYIIYHKDINQKNIFIKSAPVRDTFGPWYATLPFMHPYPIV